MRNLRRLRRKNPRAFWLTAGGLTLAILAAAVTILFMIPEVRVLWHVYWGQNYYEKAQEDKSFYQKSLEEFDKAIRMSTDYDWLALVGRGTVLGKLGKSEEQLNDCKRATEEKEEFALAWNCLGVALHSLGQHGEAIAAFDKAIDWAQKSEEQESRPQDKEKWLELQIEATYNKGDALLNNGQPEKAITTLEGALKLAQDNQVENLYHFIYNFLGKAYWKDKVQDYDESLKYYKLAIERKQDYFPARLGLGMTYYYMKQYQEAIEAFDNIINDEKYEWTKENLAQVWHNKGLALEQLGECDKAIAAQDKALEYKPDYSDAKDAKKRLIEECNKRTKN